MLVKAPLSPTAFRLLVSLSKLSLILAAFFMPFPFEAYGALSLEEKGAVKVVSADHYRLELDTLSGKGSLQLWNGKLWYPIFKNEPLPGVLINADGKTFRSPAKLELTSQEVLADKIFIGQVASLLTDSGEPTPWTLELGYEIYPEGALFISINLAYHSDLPTTIEHIELSMPVPDEKAFTRFSDQQVAKKTPALPPLRFALGVDERASYTNEIELFIEDSASPNNSLGQQSIADGRVTWRFAGGDEPIKSGRLWGFRYENRIAMAMTQAAVSSDDSDSLGARIFHWVNFLEPDDWYPTNDELEEMAGLGGTHLILHHEWMKYRGSNGYPPADYSIIRDKANFNRTIEKAHEHGMKVLLYIRGVEMFSIAAPIFQENELYDGIYVDWHGAYGNSYHDGKGEPAAFHGDGHFSEDGTYIPGHAYFLFNRDLRELVGDNGSLMGHAGSFNSGVMANFNFDGYLAGETRSERELFVSRDLAVHLGMMSSTVTMAWPEEASVFFESEGAAKMAGWGIIPHVILGLNNSRTGTLMPRSPDVELYAPIYRYWNVLNSFDFSNVEVINHPASASDTSIDTGSEDVAAIGYRDRESGQVLVLVSNLGPEPIAVELYLRGFGEDPNTIWAIESVSPDDGETIPLGQTKGTWTTPELGQWDFIGYILKPIQ